MHSMRGALYNKAAQGGKARRTDARRHQNAFWILVLSLLMHVVTTGQLSAQDAAVDPVATREYAVALGFQKKKLFDQAAVRWTQFIAKYAADSRLAHAHYHLGVCQLQSGKPEATETFRKVLSQFATFEQRDAVQFNLGLALYNTALASKKPDDFRAAAVEFTKVSTDYGQSTHVPASLSYQAESIFQAGDKAGAIGIYQRLIGQHGTTPLLPTALFALATTQQDVGQNAEPAGTGQGRDARPGNLYGTGHYGRRPDDRHSGDVVRRILQRQTGKILS